MIRRRSKVVIASAREEDSGRYECIAQSTSGYRASLAAQLLVTNDAKIMETSEFIKYIYILDQQSENNIIHFAQKKKKIKHKFLLNQEKFVNNKNNYITY